MPAFDGDEIVGGAGAYLFDTTVPGGAQVATAGVMAVGVLPTHRRRGVLTAIMRRQLADAHERGEPIAMLYAAEGGIYGRFGYGLASLAGDIELPKEHARPWDDEPLGQARLLDPDEGVEVAAAGSTTAFRPRRSGMFTRTRDWWQVRRLRQRPGKPPRQRRRDRARRRCAGLRALPPSTSGCATWSPDEARGQRGPRHVAPGARRRSGATCSRSTGSPGSTPTGCRSTTRSSTGSASRAGWPFTCSRRSGCASSTSTRRSPPGASARARSCSTCATSSVPGIRRAGRSRPARSRARPQRPTCARRLRARLGLPGRLHLRGARAGRPGRGAAARCDRPGRRDLRHCAPALVPRALLAERFDPVEPPAAERACVARGPRGSRAPARRRPCSAPQARTRTACRRCPGASRPARS